LRLVARQRRAYILANMPSSILLKTVHTMTFDCWSTLIYEAPGRHGAAARARLLANFIGVDKSRTAEALAAAWRLHQRAWHRQVVFSGPDILNDALQRLGVELPPHACVQLLTKMEEDILEREVRVVAGAREFLSALRATGVRTALICDTGFTPGRVVRGVLARVGLLESLQVTVFSDEIGVPKPHARAFATALSALGTSPDGAVHVGDLRRSDVAGARAAGMGSVRFRGHNDDREAGLSRASGVIDCATAGCNPICARPEADIVVDSYAALANTLGLRLG
jgi:FMN phosphatase YigB (HAD superfamily)